MATAKLALSFRILSADGALVREEKLTQGVIKIGKVSSAHLRVDGDETVSRMHAIIEVVGETASLIDLGSTGGTFVNGQRINKVVLKTGDSIRVGTTLIEVGIAPAGAPAPALAPTVIVAPQVLPPPVPTGIRPAPVMTAPAPAPVLAPVTRTVTAPVPHGTRNNVAAAPLSPFAASPVSPAAFAAATSDSVEDQGARAVEVAALFGDSVVSVKHCMDPRGGKVTTGTWAFIAGGAACLVASAAAFALSIGTASRNESAFEYHRTVLHKPDYSFKKEKQSLGVDFAAWGGLGLALAGLTAGLVRYRRERKSPYYRIGTAAGVEQPLEQSPAPAFPMVAPSGDDFVFNYGAGMDGEMIVDGVSTPLAQLAEQGRARPSTLAPGAIEVPIPARARICARLGMTKFVVSAVAAPRKQAAPILANVESRTLAYLGGSLAAHLAVWGFLQTIPPDVDGVAVSADETAAVAMRTSFTTNDDAAREQEKPDPADTDGEAAEGREATAMALPEGKMGNPKLTNEAHLTMERRENVDPVIAKAHAIERARNAGILGAYRESVGDLAASLAGIGNVTSGLDDATRWAGLTGEPGEGGGEFGGGRHPGGGPGGGCYFSNPAMCGTVGSSPYATNNKIGNWRGKNGDWRLDGSGPGLKRTAKIPEVHIQPPTVDGSGLTKDIIRRYIKRYHDRFKYCYETELLARPGIEGGIAVNFLISSNGSVTSANASGFDAKVSQCVATTIQSIAFPAPNDGSTVTVNYPFTFHAPK